MVERELNFFDNIVKRSPDFDISDWVSNFRMRKATFEKLCDDF